MCEPSEGFVRDLKQVNDRLDSIQQQMAPAAPMIPPAVNTLVFEF
jgi:hypothetical protein